ncbi:hypothetical protein [Streptomyces violaceus]|uniref:Uncharacterized protein n=1 Tax=Streptomyces violaceus TaxID=1936 RepID=A0ABY9UE38_STRVL|nr:hypothetical protein [Streptomyces janthinus]WND21133.1 hypothetical protein RI060_29040 [Streptomyces janthinus]GGS47989.1 hypothetical protein GCM10010270_17550 [Streptomyces janthinus]
MTTIATVRDTGQLDDTTAADIANRWNAAYPTMRTILTTSINSIRDRIQREGWNLADLPKSDQGSSKDLGAKVARLEGLRRSLGQLDRGTYRGCTRSPGGFSPVSAYWAVRDVLAATSISDRNLAAVYELAAILSFVSDARQRELAARHSA